MKSSTESAVESSFKLKISLQLIAFISPILFFSSAGFTADDFFTEAIPEYHVIHDGLIRGGRPQKGDLLFLKKMGVKTIVNIDNADSAVEHAEAQKLGLKFIASPMSSLKVPKDSQVNYILSLLQNPDLMPIFIHCKHGQDRTGMIMGMYRYKVDKWSANQAYDEMLDYGFHPILLGLDYYFKKNTHYK